MSTKRLRVDWPSCKRRGLCHEVLPELIDLDEWGYPVISGDVDREHERLAVQATKTCPQIALRLVKVPPPPK